MERIDIYNKNGEKTGRTAERGEPLSPEEYRLAVGIWISDGAGNIFVTKRAEEKSFAPGKWENTAGHVRAGETPENAVLRELREETGLAVSPEQVTLLGRAEPHWPYIGINYGVTMRFDAKDVKLQPGETCDAKWVTAEELWEMEKNGEFAPSVFEHMQGYKENFLKFISRGE